MVRTDAPRWQRGGGRRWPWSTTGRLVW